MSKESISRREFLKDAGLLIGGATVGSTVLLSSCGENTTSKTSKYVCPVDSQEFKSFDELKAHYDAAHSATGGSKGLVLLNINGVDTVLKVEDRWTLNYVLREVCNLWGTKRACERGECGMCTVIMDGRPILSCMTLAIEADGCKIETIEGLATKDGTLSKVQQAFVDYDAVQCGFCTPAQILVGEALLKFKPKATKDEIREFMGGTLCRCGVYEQMQDAVASLAK